MFSWIITIIINIITLALGVFILAKNPRDKINKSFFWLVLFILLWITSNYLENENLGIFLRMLFLRLDFALAPFLVFFFVLFCLEFSNYSLKQKFKNYLLSAVAIFSLFSFSNYIVKNIEIFNDTTVFKIGVLFLPYAILVASLTALGCYILITSYRKSSGIKKIQSFYILTGLSISALIILILNLILPQIVFIPLFISRFGIYGLIFFIFFTTLAIARYHLFGIRVILTEILVSIIAILLFTQVLISKNTFEYIWKGILFSIFLIFGYLLIKSVLREIKLREQLENAYLELQKLDKAKSEFISIASHQLRTPITAIKGYISMMLDGSYGDISGQVKGKLINVFQSNERLVRLINDLLNVSRIESGKIELNFQEVSLEDVIVSAIDILSLEAKRKKIYLRFNKPQKPLQKINVDADKIREVISNLIDNAIKYTQKGGINIEIEDKKDSILIKISDTGEGLSPEEKEKMFQSFSRGTAGTEFYTEGMGLGLYIARQFVEMHHGNIRAESPGKGKGTTFYIALPLKQPIIK